MFQDVQHALPVAVTSLFYLTPVFYPAEMVPDAIRPYYFLNPFAGLLTLFHQILYEGRMPSPALLLGTTAAACLIFIVGYLVFRRYEAVCNELM
jgi:lipopolysaccharide transport system permease protein